MDLPQIPSASRVFGRKGQVPSAPHQWIHLSQLLIPAPGPHSGVGKDIRAGAGAVPGDLVQVELVVDDAPRTVETPTDLEAALAKAPAQAKPSPRFLLA